MRVVKGIIIVDGKPIIITKSSQLFPEPILEYEKKDNSVKISTSKKIKNIFDKNTTTAEERDNIKNSLLDKAKNNTPKKNTCNTQEEKEPTQIPDVKISDKEQFEKIVNKIDEYVAGNIHRVSKKLEELGYKREQICTATSRIYTYKTKFATITIVVRQDNVTININDQKCDYVNNDSFDILMAIKNHPFFDHK